MECNKLRPEYHLLELFSAVIKILLYRNHSICLNEMCSRYLTNLEVKGIFTKGANVTTRGFQRGIIVISIFLTHFALDGKLKKKNKSKRKHNFLAIPKKERCNMR